MSSETPIFLCFPGFLGSPADFDLFHEITPEVRIIDLCGQDAPKSGQTWLEWEKRLLEKLNLGLKQRSVIVVGYSMGARVALGLISHNPSWAKAAILLSGRGALKNEYQIQQRVLSDQSWAQRFEIECWSTLMEDWNLQPVLRNSAALRPAERDFEREVLSRVLNTFSLSQQRTIMQSAIRMPALICWGQYDAKFKAEAVELSRLFVKPYCQEVLSSGHRILRDNPRAVLEQTRHFISSISP